MWARPLRLRRSYIEKIPRKAFRAYFSSVQLLTSGVRYATRRGAMKPAMLAIMLLRLNTMPVKGPLMSEKVSMQPAVKLRFPMITAAVRRPMVKIPLDTGTNLRDTMTAANPRKAARQLQWKHILSHIFQSINKRHFLNEVWSPVMEKVNVNLFAKKRLLNYWPLRYSSFTWPAPRASFVNVTGNN